MSRIKTIFSVFIFALTFSITPLVQASSPAIISHKTSLSPMLKRVMPCIVNLSVHGRIPWISDAHLRHSGPRQPRPREFHQVGSGVIVDAKDGYIITNAHVVHNAETIIVTLNDGRHLIGRLIGEDEKTDIAVLQIHDEHLKAIKRGDSSGVDVGDFVTAIGNPFGLHQSVTSGVVSGLHRRIGIEGLENFIQTDAPINPGNSGGALVNLKGELVGMNTAIIGPAGANIGIGFAIPINMVNSVMDQLIQYGDTKPGILGVIVQDMTPRLATALGVPGHEGAVVNEVMPKSGAAKAGIRTSDILTHINGEAVSSANQVRSMVGVLRAGSTVTLDMLRQGKKKRLSATVQERPKPDPKKEKEKKHNVLEGLELTDYDQLDQYGRRIKGVRVVHVIEGKRAWLSGIRPDDVILFVNQHLVPDLNHFLSLVNKEHSDQYLLMVRRGNNRVFVVID